MKCPDDPESAECAYLEGLTTTNPALADANRFSQRVALMVRKRQDDWLDSWLTEAEGREVVAQRPFAQVLREVWSSGMTAGFANILTLVKRQMYGRAGFTLLRRRVPRSASCQLCPRLSIRLC